MHMTPRNSSDTDMTDFEVHLGDSISPLYSPGKQSSFLLTSPLKFNEVCDTNKDYFENTEDGCIKVLWKEEPRQIEAQASASTAKVIKRKEEDFNYDGVLSDNNDM